MPSKLQHELNKIRGKSEDEKQIYQQSLAYLQTIITKLEKEVIILEEEKIKHNTRLNQAQKTADNANRKATEEHGAERQKNRTRTFYINNPIEYNTEPDWYGFRFDDTVVEGNNYSFRLPADYLKIISISLIWTQYTHFGAEKTWVFNAELISGKTGGSHNDFDNFDNDNIYTSPTDTAGVIFEETLDNSLFTGAERESLITLIIERNPVHASDNFAGDIGISGFKIVYEADM